MIADCGATPETTAVGVETDKNLLVVALQGAGFEVFAINPRAVARYRERNCWADIEAILSHWVLQPHHCRPIRALGFGGFNQRPDLGIMWVIVVKRPRWCR